MTDSIVIGPTGETFLFDVFEPDHVSAPSMSVDDVVHIDGDNTNHVLKIQKTLLDTHKYISCLTATGEERFSVYGGGAVFMKNLSVDEIDCSALTEEFQNVHALVAQEVTDRYQIDNALTQRIDTVEEDIENNTQTITNLTTLTDNHSDQHVSHAAQIALNQTAIQDNSDNITVNQTGIQTNAQSLTELTDDVESNALAIQEASHEHQEANYGDLIERQETVEFKNIEAEKVVSTLFETQNNVEILADGQLLWVPYQDSGQTDGNGQPIYELEPNALFRFGRSEQIGAGQLGTEDGLLMSREITNKDHSVFLGVHPNIPNLHISSDKPDNTPFILCTGSDENEQLFAINADGGIISAGQFSHDFSALPDSFHGSSVHDPHSVYIGSAKLDFDEANRILKTYVLKESHVPTRLASGPYNFTSSIFGNGQLNVHEFMQLARQAYTPTKHDLKVSEIFPQGNLALDWNEQTSSSPLFYLMESDLTNVDLANAIQIPDHSQHVIIGMSYPQNTENNKAYFKMPVNSTHGDKIDVVFSRGGTRATVYLHTTGNPRWWPDSSLTNHTLGIVHSSGTGQTHTFIFDDGRVNPGDTTTHNPYWIGI